jgi:hypothetical protein
MNSTRGGMFQDLFFTDKAMESATKILFAELPTLQTKGLSGMYYGTPGTLRGVSMHPGNASGTANVITIWKPILEKMQSIPGMIPFQSKILHFKNYKAYYDGTHGPRGKMQMRKRHGPEEEDAPPMAKGIVPLAGHLITPAALRSPDIMSGFSMDQTIIGEWSVMCTAPGKAVGDGKDTSANPGWRKATAQAMIVRVNGLRNLDPEVGVYGNEASSLSNRKLILGLTNETRHSIKNLIGRRTSGETITQSSPK